MANIITQASMPDDVQKRFELVADLPGGPEFYVQQLSAEIDFSKITLNQAERLAAAAPNILAKRQVSTPAVKAIEK